MSVVIMVITTLSLLQSSLSLIPFEVGSDYCFRGPMPVSRGSLNRSIMVPHKMLRKQICLLVHYMAVVITKYPLVTQEAKNEELPS